MTRSQWKVDSDTFIAEVYRNVGGNLIKDVGVWEIGDALGWDRDRTKDTLNRLLSQGWVEGAYMSPPGIRITVQGIDAAERLQGGNDRDIRVRRLLRAIYEDAKGSECTYVSLSGSAVKVGFKGSEGDELLEYVRKKGLVRFKAAGRLGSITTLGILEVERSEGQSVVPSAVASPLPPHDDDRRYGILRLDTAGHSTIVGKHHRAEVDRLFRALRDLVELETIRRSGVLVSWEGDGGLVLFPGASSQQRSVEAANAILDALPYFNSNENPTSSLVQLRIAVHSGVFPMPADPKDIHSEDINLTVHLEEEAALPDSVTVTQDVFKELPEAMRRKFVAADEPFEGKVIYRREMAAGEEIGIVEGRP